MKFTDAHTTQYINKFQMLNVNFEFKLLFGIFKFPKFKFMNELNLNFCELNLPKHQI